MFDDIDHDDDGDVDDIIGLKKVMMGSCWQEEMI